VQHTSHLSLRELVTVIEELSVVVR
jgi:hypothetical protein